MCCTIAELHLLFVLYNLYDQYLCIKYQRSVKAKRPILVSQMPIFLMLFVLFADAVSPWAESPVRLALGIFNRKWISRYSFFALRRYMNDG